VAHDDGTETDGSGRTAKDGRICIRESDERDRIKGKKVRETSQNLDSARR